MSALTITPGNSVSPARGPHLAGASLPPVLRTAGAMMFLLAALALTGLMLVAMAVVLPLALLAAAIMGPHRAGERRGWRPAPV